MESITLPARWRFFESYAEALMALEEDDRHEEAKDLLWAIYEYSSWGIEPEITDSSMSMAWALIKPNLDSSVNAYISGKRGGTAKAARRNTRKKEDPTMSMLTADESRRVRKLTKAIGDLYDNSHDEFVAYEDDTPDSVYEDQAKYALDERQREFDALIAYIDDEEKPF